MPRQYVHPGPAAKIASQVRQITLSPEAIEALNALIDALLYSILGEITALQVLQYSQPTIYIDGVQTKRQEDVIRLPITTESFRNACLAVCDKSNTLAREALLDSDLILNEWMNRKGTKSDAALPSPSREKRKVRSKSTSNVREQISLVVPPFTRSLSNRSTSTLQSISDAGESDAEAGAGLTEDISMPATTKGYDFNSRASALASAPVATVLSELQAALELILPLRNFNHHENTLKAHIDVISKGATSNLDVKYTTPLLVLYVSTFLSHLIFTIIKGTAGIVEMVPTMTEASVEELHEYMSSDDRLRSLSKNLVSSGLYRFTPFPETKRYARMMADSCHNTLAFSIFISPAYSPTSHAMSMAACQCHLSHCRISHL